MESYWLAGAPLPRFNKARGDERTDVLIIGGGLAGILTAFLLKESGVKTIVAEKGRIFSGESGRTTAKITFQHGLIYHRLAKKNSYETAKKYLEANRAAFDLYKTLCAGIDCDYEIKDNFVYSVDDPAALDSEMAALQKLGYGAELCRELPLPIKTAGAVRFPEQAQFHPVKFISEIAKGLNILENTFVRAMEGNTAITDSGKIYADKVIVATHYPFINKHGAYFLKLYQHRSYVLALKNAQDVKGMYVDDCKTGLSFRNAGELLLLGGADHRTGKKGGGWAELEQFAQTYYPASSEQYRWAAQDCMSLDEMPYIGRYSKNTTDLYVASGFNKWGVTGSLASAMLLRDMVLGRDYEYADIFSPSRSMLTPQLFINILESAIGLLTPKTKRCPHLGCALNWNKAERSWDCACHGSRFSETGKLLDNPANGDLRRN
ncbi:MAG: FAD-dependent oxidoreductase [Oscillospiraceae bacterium]|nr:FAD-dependent oxidoreductase [Oscillospiraceae bacterium]